MRPEGVHRMTARDAHAWALLCIAAIGLTLVLVMWFA